MFNRLFPIGTRSLLFGVHQFIIHPFVVAVAWWKLYGFPFDPRLWVAFAVHDLGYWGCPNMDGPEGEGHVEFGARVMAVMFGPYWGDFCRYHSRFRARQDGRRYSQLCVADKLAAGIEPWWLYLPRAWLSGELGEYMAIAGGKGDSKYKGEPHSDFIRAELAKGTIRGWHTAMATYCREWALEHLDGKIDVWTPGEARE